MLNNLYTMLPATTFINSYERFRNKDRKITRQVTENTAHHASNFYRTTDQRYEEIL